MIDVDLPVPFSYWQGFRGDGNSCVDADECAETPGICGTVRFYRGTATSCRVVGFRGPLGA